MTDNELRPCPFCGGEATLVNNHWGGKDHWSGMCDGECGVWLDSRADTKAEAITAWNTRAPATEQSSDVAELVDALNKEEMSAATGTLAEAIKDCKRAGFRDAAELLQMKTMPETIEIMKANAKSRFAKHRKAE